MKSLSILLFISSIAVLAAGLIISIANIFRLRSRQRQILLKQEKLERDVESKSKELTTDVIYIVRKNELMNSAAQRLLRLQNPARAEDQAAIQEIALELRLEADSDIWKEFEMRFHQIHSEFYGTLRRLYPALSPTEEKLCALLRLNLNSREIAALTQQSVTTLELARSNLRKKLDLTSTSSSLLMHLTNLEEVRTLPRRNRGQKTGAKVH